jgi:hypothetical protein
VLALLLLGSPTHATSLIEPLSLPELVQASHRAALVEAVSTRHGYDTRKLHSTWVTLRILEPLYGADLGVQGASIEIKLYGSREPVPDGSRLVVSGSPDFEPGERYLLLLGPTTAWGFTGVIGLFQGMFHVRQDGQGREMAAAVGGNRLAFGREGLERWLDRGSLSTTEKALLDRQDREVPYSLLREAVLRLRAGSRKNGGE